MLGTLVSRSGSPPLPGALNLSFASSIHVSSRAYSMMQRLDILDDPEWRNYTRDIMVHTSPLIPDECILIIERDGKLGHYCLLDQTRHVGHHRNCDLNPCVFSNVMSA